MTVDRHRIGDQERETDHRHQCLSAEEILALAEGRLKEADAFALLSSLEGCDDCFFLLAEAGLAVSEESGDDSFLSPFGPGAQVFRDEDLVAGRYRIVRFLGRGGMGEVYEAEDRELGERLALKTMNPLLLAEDEANLNRFKREIRLARQVVHRNVCRVLEFGRHDTNQSGPVFFMTMELVEGEPLDVYLKKRGPLPVDEASRIVKDICDGLGAIHDTGVLHRDIKANNVMLCRSMPKAPEESPRVVLLDFGIARSIDTGHTDGLTNGIVGTPDYMAPEQLQGHDLTTATDIYSTGVVFFQLLTGRRPFEEGTSFKRALRRLRERPPPPSHFREDLPASMNALVLACLDPDPGARPQTAQELAEGLDRLSLFPRSNPFPKERSSARQIGWIAAFSLGLLVLTGSVFALRSSDEADKTVLDARSATAPPQKAAPSPALVETTTTAKQESRVASPHPPAPIEPVDVAAPPPLLSPSPAPAQAKKPRQVHASPRPTATKQVKASSPADTKPTKNACSPPYYVDQDGLVVFRKECL